MSPNPTHQVKQFALEVGFDRVGIAPAAPTTRTGFLDQWLQDGRAGRMEYLHRYRASRENPAELLAGARSVIVVSLNYYQEHDPSGDDSSSDDDSASDPGSVFGDSSAKAKVARYAWGKDYHRVLKRKLWELIDRMRAEFDEPFDAKPCCDTAPVVERELAAAAGIGWIGKNTMVLNAEQGSYFFLGEIVTTLALEPDEPVVDHCGSCTQCLEACPTQAFPNAYEMDASRCISYLTIELRESIPESLRPMMGNWVFGCDVCQEVCPYNADPPTTKEPAFDLVSDRAELAMDDVVNWSPADYREALRGSAAKRAKLSMMRRNAAVVLGNKGSLTDAEKESLIRAAKDDDTLVAEHAAWALRQHGASAD